ncbi:hypothetical protein B0H17DRAFT_42640 [Mycena rosella]|uniref:Homeobox domain-containing protein n=1 Tax=Mycena rosella TaxID=1033263 RepID=A0AAD7GEB9_MYCRO|nr:hypothetical protein B0H17DRAFT_42640 [Mycena rosella]
MRTYSSCFLILKSRRRAIGYIIFPFLFFCLTTIYTSLTMSNRDERYYNTHRARSPAADQSGVFFQTGQGGRTLLPPISSAFPISHFPASPHSNQYTQPRSSPGRYDYPQSYNNQWQSNAPMPAPQPAFGYYDDGRYPAQPAYPAAYPRSATVAPGHHSDLRKLPPLSTTPAPSRDERWASPYPPAFNATPNTHIRSPTASYPASYTTAYPPQATNPYGYHVNDPRCVPALSPQLMANDPRAVSPYGRRGTSHTSPPTPPPVSPIGSDEPAVKKKRKRADAAQLRVLNETYARTAFPSTEERLALAKALDMSPRSVQIWFQNKRQSMRQTNRQSSNAAHQPFSLSPDDQIIDDLDYESAMASSRPSTSQMPSSSHRRARSQEEVIDPRKWPRGY